MPYAFEDFFEEMPADISMLQDEPLEMAPNGAADENYFISN